MEADTKIVVAVELACAAGAVDAGTCLVEQLTRVEGQTLAEACEVEAGVWVETAGIAFGGGAVEEFLDLGRYHYPQLLVACAVQLPFCSMITPHPNYMNIPGEHSGLLFCSVAMLGTMHTHTADAQQVVPLLDPGG